MEPKQILSASLLDIVFDDRNKSYGAYNLRLTYPDRIKKSLLITLGISVLVFGGAIWASSLKPKQESGIQVSEVTLSKLVEDPQEPEPIPEPPKKPDPVQTQTEKLTNIAIVEDDKAPDPPPDQDDLKKAQISDFKTDGIEYNNVAVPADISDGQSKGIIEQPKNIDPEIVYGSVEISARYDGNWEKFLLQNLRPEVPVDNEAPAGRYQVMIQFVVDKEGNISDMKPLTNIGYGMEQEAMRVLRKAKGWKPGIQNGLQVKSYHRQPITFVVE